MIPVLVTPEGVAVQDTADIVDHVERVESGPSVFPAGPVQKLASLLLELYADEWLIIPATHYRWTYNEAWIVGEFGRFRGSASARIRLPESRRIMKASWLIIPRI